MFPNFKAFYYASVSFINLIKLFHGNMFQGHKAKTNKEQAFSKNL